jgi:hypothetical protein
VRAHLSTADGVVRIELVSDTREEHEALVALHARITAGEAIATEILFAPSWIAPALEEGDAS